MRDVTLAIICLTSSIRLVSTHTPHAGRDFFCFFSVSGSQKFLLTRPMRDVTYVGLENRLPMTFLLTRPMRDVTRCYLFTLATSPVSTHTPHAGRDMDYIVFENCAFVSTHTPHAGRDI